MNFISWRERVDQLLGSKAFEFVSTHGLQDQFPEITEAFTGTLAVYPGGLVITESNGLFRLVLGNTERSGTSREPLEKALFRWAWDQDRLVA
ncbi:MAG TPA: hypothetical protein ENH62_05040 [Marinobacter sp.]|uniref:Uncharacterized protein n=1 Tax=marine sediment metagenome TaxID=412755 RepID=A0A0F9Q3I5_9ZZZZ|nr:hypothetical protein [Marinobacter sp.]